MTRVKAEAARSAGTRSVSLEACHSGDYLSGNKSQKASERFMSLEGPSEMSPDIVISLISFLAGCASSTSSQPPDQEAKSAPVEDTSKTPSQWNPVECWIAKETWWLPRSARESHGCQ